MVEQFRDLEPDNDLSEDLLRRKLHATMNDPRPPILAEEVFSALEARYAEPTPAPAR